MSALAEEALAVLGDGATQFGGAATRRVLVEAGADRGDCCLCDGSGSILVGVSLPQVDRVVLGCEGAHLGEDRRADGAVGVAKSGGVDGA